MTDTLAISADGRLIINPDGRLMQGCCCDGTFPGCPWCGAENVTLRFTGINSCNITQDCDSPNYLCTRGLQNTLDGYQVVPFDGSFVDTSNRTVCVWQKVINAGASCDGFLADDFPGWIELGKPRSYVRVEIYFDAPANGFRVTIYGIVGLEISGALITAGGDPIVCDDELACPGYFFNGNLLTEPGFNMCTWPGEFPSPAVNGADCRSSGVVVCNNITFPALALQAGYGGLCYIEVGP